MKKLISVLLTFAMSIGLSACGSSSQATPSATPTSAPSQVAPSATATTATTASTAPTATGKSIILATTTSIVDSGLMGLILPDFTKKTGIEVKVVSVGTGKAFKTAKEGNADVLVVHAKSKELQFIKDGFATDRYDVMYDDFILVGPASDPAGILKNAPTDIDKAFTLLNSENAKFISRGDNSGTNMAENAIWKAVGVDTTKMKNYVSAGKGMGDDLIMTSEMNGYTLTDRATYLTMKDKLKLQILCQGDKKLFNQYGVLRLASKDNPNLKTDEANQFITWILSADTQKAIGNFGVDKFGKAVYKANATSDGSPTASK